MTVGVTATATIVVTVDDTVVDAGVVTVVSVRSSLLFN